VNAVFISHSSQDRAWIEEHVLPVLEERGVEAWFAPRDISVGVEWPPEILLGLEQCEAFLVVLSDPAVASDWVLAELTWALEHRKGRFFSVLKEPCRVERLSLRLLTVQHADFSRDRGAGRERLSEALRAAAPGLAPPPRWPSDPLVPDVEETVEVGGDAPSRRPPSAACWTRHRTTAAQRETFSLSGLSRGDAARVGRSLVDVLRSRLTSACVTACRLSVGEERRPAPDSVTSQVASVLSRLRVIGASSGAHVLSARLDGPGVLTAGSLSEGPCRFEDGSAVLWVHRERSRATLEVLIETGAGLAGGPTSRDEPERWTPVRRLVAPVLRASHAVLPDADGRARLVVDVTGNGLEPPDESFERALRLLEASEGTPGWLPKEIRLETA
jgi:hypothetical protein